MLRLLGSCGLALAVWVAPAAAQPDGEAPRHAEGERWEVETVATGVHIGELVSVLDASDARIRDCVFRSDLPGRGDRTARVRVSRAGGWTSVRGRALSACVAAALEDSKLFRPELRGTLTVRLRTASEPGGDANDVLGGDVPLRIVSETPGVRLWLRATPSDEAPTFWRQRPWARACVNCRLELTAGDYQIGAGDPESIEPVETLTLSTDTRAVYEHTSYEGLRRIGTITAILGSAALFASLIALIPVGLAQEASNAAFGSSGDAPDTLMIGIGISAAVGLGLTVIGIPMASTGDDHEIQFLSGVDQGDGT